MDLAFPAFRARPPWYGPDLQTIRNVLRPPLPLEDEHAVESELLLPMADGSGDLLVAAANRPGAETTTRPTVVLIHGLSGSSESTYMLSSARHWLARAHPVLRLNLRGAGRSRAHCRTQYHAGRTRDLNDALFALDREWTANGLVLIGYSLGGNMLLKFMAEYAGAFPILAAASISAPIDLAAASSRFMQLRNVFYQRVLLQSMKEECFGGAAEISVAESARVLAARSVREFDDRFVAPRNGYRDADHYYAENQSRRFLSGIEVPTLVIHALDDPWIPAEAYTSYPWPRHPKLIPLLASGGGHVGFHDRSRESTWYDQCIGLYIDQHLD